MAASDIANAMSSAASVVYCPCVTFGEAGEPDSCGEFETGYQREGQGP